VNKRAWISVLWPAFLCACAFEGLVFALVDPSDLHWGRDGVGLSRQGIYSVGFFVFWAMAACSGALTVAFLRSPPEEPATRPD